MGVKVIVAATEEPVSLDAAKRYLRVDAEHDDALIQAQISEAREYAERYTQLSWAGQTLEMALHAFPAGAIQLPQVPKAGTVSVTYTDADGEEQTLAPDSYVLDEYGMAASLFPVGAWPSAKAVPNAVKVRYTVGGTDEAPFVVYAAILAMLAHLYEHREDAGEPPPTVHRLLDMVRGY